MPLSKNAYLLFCFAFATTAALPSPAKDHATVKLTVRAITHDSRVNEQTHSYTTPSTSNTNCSGTGLTTGAITNVSANCQTTSTPSQTHQTTSRTIDVVNIVEADGQRYKIVCRANWGGSNCSTMIDGDSFDAEIDQNTMWIVTRKGGNQGKEIRVKYKILDIRPVPAN
jgi:hypothetical protein